MAGGGRDGAEPAAHDREHGAGVREDRGLGVVGEGELVLGALPHEAGERDAERVIDGGEGVARGGKPLGEILAHADLLRALAREEQDRHHRTTALPR